MGRSGWKTTASVRTNKAKGNGSKGLGVSFHSYEVGERQRVAIPMFKFEDGTVGPLILQEPIHKIEKLGAIKIKKADGTYMSPRNIRCTHPFHQGDDASRQKAYDSQEYCVFDELLDLEKTKRYAIINERYGSYEKFEVLSKEERTAFWKEMDKDTIVKECYSKKKGEDAHYDMVTQILLYQFETETTTEKNARNISITKTSVIRDEDGQPKFKPVLFNLSKQRQKKFEDAANTAYEKEILTDDMVYPLYEGTDNPSMIGWVDFELNFPDASEKMESGKNLSITASDEKTSVVTKEFIALHEDTEKGVEIYKKAEESFYNANISLKYMTKAEQIASFADGGAYYRELLEKYGTQQNKDFQAKILSGGFSKTNVEDATTVEEVVETKVETKVTAPVVDEEVDLDNDLIDLEDEDLDDLDDIELV